ncbi:hypothetical protein AB0D24_15115 [Streptomyces javensis]|uniref:hypothetical protein n=1 Tax=Streptomyces javensis TaxID=114698 RepID=UPI0033DA9B85
MSMAIGMVLTAKSTPLGGLQAQFVLDGSVDEEQRQVPYGPDDAQHQADPEAAHRRAHPRVGGR